MRTAPTPSQPPTPYAESEKPLPGQQQSTAEQNEDHEDKVVQEDVEDGEGRISSIKEEDLAAETAEKCVISDPAPEPVASNPPDLVSHVPPALPSSSPEAADTGADTLETDSLADLDIVAVGGAGDAGDSPPANMTVPGSCGDAGGDDLGSLDSPPEMPDTPEPGSVSPVISLPDAPSSEPGSPELKVDI